MDRSEIAYALNKQVGTVHQVQSAYGPIDLDEELAAVVGEALRKCLTARLNIIDGDGEWQPMSEAPRDGTWIQVEIVGHGSDNVVAWVDGFTDNAGSPCSCWCFMAEQEPPDDWTDGACWESNEDEVPSTPPSRWKALPASRVEADHSLPCPICRGRGMTGYEETAEMCTDCDGTGKQSR